MSKHITVLLVDDHALVRNMLSDRLNSVEDIAVLSSLDNAEQAITEAERLKPDVMVMDIDMPGISCFEAVRTIRKISSNTRAVFLSAFFNDAYIDQALQVEASGYLTKSEPPEKVIEAVRASAAGKRFYSREVESRIVVDANGIHLASQPRTRASLLSPRELEILRYIARGLSQKEIAKVTNRSSKTIHRHCNNIMSKLDIHDRVDLARFAIREGLAEA